jgi:tetratricopeptide (TPR) repeat protein
LIEDDPELAYQHAKTARRLAARLGGVREAVAVTAYLSEHYDEALTEFRAVRRMTGNQEVLPTMADCERALGRPEKALALSREKQVKDLEPGSQIEMLIVAAGARRDMGQTAAAIQTLEVPELAKRTRAEWLPRLRYAYADALQEAGRTDEALVWFHRAAGVDGDGVTGAAERAAELEGLQFTDLDDEEDEDGRYVDEPIVDDALDGQLDIEDDVDAPAASEENLENEVDHEAAAGLESDHEAAAGLESDDDAAAGLESDDEAVADLDSHDEAAAELGSDEDELGDTRRDGELNDHVDGKPQD